MSERDTLIDSIPRTLNTAGKYLYLGLFAAIAATGVHHGFVVGELNFKYLPGAVTSPAAVVLLALSSLGLGFGVLVLMGRASRSARRLEFGLEEDWSHVESIVNSASWLSTNGPASVVVALVSAFILLHLSFALVRADTGPNRALCVMVSSMPYWVVFGRQLYVMCRSTSLGPFSRWVIWKLIRNESPEVKAMSPEESFYTRSDIEKVAQFFFEWWKRELRRQGLRRLLVRREVAKPPAPQFKIIVDAYVDRVERAAMSVARNAENKEQTLATLSKEIESLRATMSAEFQRMWDQLPSTLPLQWWAGDLVMQRVSEIDSKMFSQLGKNSQLRRLLALGSAIGSIRRLVKEAKDANAE